VGNRPDSGLGRYRAESPGIEGPDRTPLGSPLILANGTGLGRTENPSVGGSIPPLGTRFGPALCRVLWLGTGF
jgi:hypothetical protein